ncbi:MAG: shikimate dehydrogenase [Chloroflexota bacterium]|nr:shikimate dehydrogenase [Chloroflexota bacterium]
MTRATPKRLGVIGYPIRHSISPAFQQAALDHLAIPARYERYEVHPETLPAFIANVRGEEWLGINVTIPHKQTIIPLLDGIESRSRQISSVNTILRGAGDRLHGCTTDSAGFLRALRESGFRCAGARAVVLGTGGSARAIVTALLDAGADSIHVIGRSAARAADLVASLLPLHARREQSATDAAALHWSQWDPQGMAALLRAADLLVNTTPIGMRGGGRDGESPVSADALHLDLTVFDAVYNPINTPLLRLSQAAGAQTVSGLDMLVYQGAESFRLWTGQDAPIEIMMRTARAALA